LAPVASGLITDAQGWRWMYWWTTILLGINVLLFIFCYEETKYIPRPPQGVRFGTTPSPGDTTRTASQASYLETDEKPPVPEAPVPRDPDHFQGIDHSIPMKPLRERLAFTTTTPAPFSKLLVHTYQPFIMLFTIPAILYCALQYGALLAWFSVIVTSEAEFFILAPYNFTETGIGLLCMPAFIGCIVGFFWGGPLSDWSIVFFTRRNKGIYEPEMRLYFALLPAILGPVGLFVYGYSTAAVWPLCLCLFIMKH
jgi:hypothetical protein